MKNINKTARVIIIFLITIAWIFFSWPQVFHFPSKVEEAKAATGWYNSSWQYRKQLILDHTLVSGSADLSSFPVLISYTDANLKTTANGGHVTNSSGYDIIFTASDGTTKLDHEIETYTSTTGAIVMWVRFPTLPYAADTDFYIYYGNSSISTSQENVTGVWSENGANNYKGVWHLKENPSGAAPQMLDSTSNNWDGTSYGTMLTADQVASQINGGLDFEGINDAVNHGDINDIDGATALTVEAWVKVTNLTRDGMIFSKGTFAASQALLFWRDETTAVGGRTNTLSVQVGSGATDVKLYGTTGKLNDNNWHYVVATYLGNSTTGLRTYVDSTEDAQGPVSTTSVTALASTATAAWIGRSSGGSPYFTGGIDEVRISNTVRSSDWIKTTYNNYTNQGTGSGKFIKTLGVEEVESISGVITVGTTGIQVSTLSASSTNQYVGGAFTLVRNTGSANITQIIITETGTVNATTNLSNVKLYYKTETSCSSSIPGDATVFNATGVAFNASQKATATGTMAVSTSQICVYVQLDVGSGAGDGQTLDIEISVPSTDVTVSAGSVSPGTTVAISGSTTLVTPGPSSTLSLQMSDVTKNPMVFTLSNGAIWMQEGSQSAVQITSNAATVTSLSFSNYSASGTPGTIRIQFTVSHPNPEGRNEYDYTKTFYGSASLRHP